MHDSYERGDSFFDADAAGAAGGSAPSFASQLRQRNDQTTVKDGLSSIDPGTYQLRFVDFIRDITV